MNERPSNPESEVEERIDKLRDGIEDADATDMVAGEAEIAQAEILRPLLEGGEVERSDDN